MSKEITKAHILQEIEDRFKLRELVPEKFAFLESVRPVYDISTHLKIWKISQKDVSITAASGYSFFTVPQNERWHLRAYDMIFMGAGAYTVTGAYLVRRPGTNSIYLDMKAGQSVSYHVEFANEIVMNAGDLLKVLIDGYTSTQDLRLVIDHYVEEIR